MKILSLIAIVLALAVGFWISEAHRAPFLFIGWLLCSLLFIFLLAPLPPKPPPPLHISERKLEILIFKRDVEINPLMLSREQVELTIRNAKIGLLSSLPESAFEIIQEEKTIPPSGPLHRVTIILRVAVPKP
jgi:hypothetical protein